MKKQATASKSNTPKSNKSCIPCVGTLVDISEEEGRISRFIKGGDKGAKK